LAEGLVNSVVGRTSATLKTAAGQPSRVCQHMVAPVTGRALPVEVLCQIRGVGRYIAMLVIAEVGDIGRFQTARRLCSWAGMTPTVHSSDLRTRLGHISRTAKLDHGGCPADALDGWSRLRAGCRAGCRARCGLQQLAVA
jgi:hypothetical protein